MTNCWFFLAVIFHNMHVLFYKVSTEAGCVAVGLRYEQREKLNDAAGSETVGWHLHPQSGGRLGTRSVARA